MKSFSRLLAIAMLTVRNAVRTRVFQCMLAVVVLTVLGLPLIIRSDGTIAGYAQVTLGYSLSFLTFILTAASLWASVAASSGEIKEKQIHLLVTKPVSPLQLWVGKWLGLMIMNASLLILAGFCVSAMLRWNLRPSALTVEERRVASEEVLTARRPVEPDQPDIEAKVLKRAEELAAGIKPGTISREALLADVRREVLRSENTVQAGASKKWIFSVGGQDDRNSHAHIRYVISSPRQLDLKPVAVEWFVYGIPAAGNSGTKYSGQIFAGRPDSFAVDIGPSGNLAAEFVNAQTNPPATAAFSLNRGVTLLMPYGSFEGNLARALIIIFCKLAILSALGLTMGCVFSMPVAVFVACSAIAVFNLTGVLTAEDYSHPAGAHGVLDTVMMAKYKLANAISAPIRRYDPVDRLQRGELIPWPLVGEALAVQLLVYSGVLGLIGVLVLKRRQFGLPAD